MRLLLQLAISRTVSSIGGLRTLLRHWASHLFTVITGPEGWRIFGKILANLSVICGIPIALLTYHSAVTEQRRGEVERSYYQLLHDLDDQSLQVRIGAIERLPELMTQKVPPPPQESVVSQFLSIAITPESATPIYHLPLETALLLHVKHLSRSSPTWQIEEVYTIIDILGRIGGKGWYGDELPTTPDRRDHSLFWIWNGQVTMSDSVSPITIFENARLDTVNLEHFDLTHSDFRMSSLRSATLTFTAGPNSDFSDADLSGADLSQSNYKYAVFDRANLTGAYLTSSLFQSATLRGVNLANAHMVDILCNQCNLEHGILSGADLQQAVFVYGNLENALLVGTFAVGSDFRGADLSFADLVGASLQSSSLVGAKFAYADARGTLFKGADITHADFRRSDLRGADLSDVKGLTEVRDWDDANISDVKGLSQEQVRYLMSRGAISIQSDSAWQAYREAGRPHESWNTYVSSSVSKGARQ